MDNNLLFIIVAILFFIYIKRYNRECFKSGPLSKTILNERCESVSKDLEEVNTITNQVCDNTEPDIRYRTTNNSRLTCRNFEDRTIFMNDNANSWCDMAGSKTKFKDIQPIYNFTGLGKLDYADADLKPPSNYQLVSNFPF